MFDLRLSAQLFSHTQGVAHGKAVVKASYLKQHYGPGSSVFKSQTDAIGTRLPSVRKGMGLLSVMQRVDRTLMELPRGSGGVKFGYQQGSETEMPRPPDIKRETFPALKYRFMPENEHISDRYMVFNSC
jgi:hypothetical protein